MAGKAGGRSSVKDIESGSGLAVVAKPRRLQLEHRPITAARRHQLVVGAELDHAAVLQHADAVGVAHRREAVRDQDRGSVPRGGEDAVEDLGLAADVELGGRLVERSEEHTSELQSLAYLVCRLLLEKKKIKKKRTFDWIS